MCYYESDKRCGDFSLKMRQRQGSARTRWVGELNNAPPDLILDFRGRSKDKRKGMGKDMRGGRLGKEGDRGMREGQNQKGANEEGQGEGEKSKGRGGESCPHGHF